MSRPVNASAKDLALVTPADDGNLNHATMGLPIALVVSGNAGTVRVLTAADRDITIPASLLPVGQIFPLCIKRVYATSTTATDVHVLYGVG